jgi:hypothetical protein
LWVSKNKWKRYKPMYIPVHCQMSRKRKNHESIQRENNRLHFTKD